MFEGIVLDQVAPTPPVFGGENPPCFYTVNDRTNEAAWRGRVIVYLQYMQWSHYEGADDRCVDTVVRHIGRDTGVSPGRAERYLDGLDMLAQLPHLSAAINLMWHIDLETLAAITTVLHELDIEDEAYLTTLSTIDVMLTDYLTPTRANQKLPGRAAIMRRLRELLKELDPRIAHGDKDPHDRAELRFADDPSGMTFMEGVFEPVRGKIIKDTITAHAKHHAMSMQDALLDIVTGGAPPKIVLNVFTIDDPDAPLWVDGVGYLDHTTEQWLVDQVSMIRELNHAAGVNTDAYQTPELLQLFIKARDGHCVEPTCRRSAFGSQCDHVINHADGGRTNAAGLASLCQHHHNEKTEGRFTYRIDTKQGTVTTTNGDGRETVAEMDGPLSPAGIRWMTTVAQRRRARKATRRTRSMDKTREWIKRHPETVRSPIDDTPPPF